MDGIIVSVGRTVRIFDGATGAMVRQFLAYGSVFRGNLNVAVGDVNPRMRPLDPLADGLQEDTSLEQRRIKEGLNSLAATR